MFLVQGVFAVLAVGLAASLVVWCAELLLPLPLSASITSLGDLH